MNIERVEWCGVEAVRLTTAEVEVVGVYAYGPRLASLRYRGGDNILLWQPQSYLRRVAGQQEWDLRGGHRCWHAGNGADECEMTYASDNAPAECAILEDGFRLTGALDPLTQTRRGIELRALADDRLEVDSFTINCGQMLFGAAPWALSCTLPNETTRYLIPLGDGSSFDTATVVLFKEWAGHGPGRFDDDQFTITEDAMVVTPRGRENKRMIQSHAGVIAMSDPQRELTFAKRVLHRNDARYPLNTNTALYIGPDNFMVEMETMGGESCLKPGQSMQHVEEWVLSAGALESLTAAAALALFA